MRKTLIALMPNMKGGGAQRVMGLILKNAAEAGYEAELILIDKDAPIEYKLDDRIKVKYIPKQKGNKLFRRLGLLKFLYKYTRVNRDAIFLSFLTERNIDLLLVAPRKVKVVVSERNDPARSIKNSKFWIKLRNIVYTKAWKVVFQTQDAMDYFSNVKGIHGVIISNPITGDLPYYQIGNQNKIIISVARLSSQKNYPMLIDAFEIVHEKYPDYELHIWGKEYGEVGISEKLNNYAQTKKSKDSIIFKGFSNDVHQYVANASIFVSSSDYEGMSNSMIEALAIGIPCICTDCPIGGARMFIEDGFNGLLTSVGDSAEMANAIIRMIEDGDLRKRCIENANKIREELNEEKIFELWQGVFE